MIETQQEAAHLENGANAEEPLSEPLSSLSVELARISAEIQSINAGFQAQIQQAIAEKQTAMEDQYALRLREAIGEVRGQVEGKLRESLQKEFETELEKGLAGLERARTEAERVSAQLASVSEEIARMIENPDIELYLVIRKKSEEAELRAYLNGLRYAINA